MTRKSLNLTVKVEAFMENALCPKCMKPFAGDVQFDHEIALAEGGKDHDEVALVPLHAECHKLKTKADKKRIAKVKRMAGETGQQARRARNGSSFRKPEGYVSPLSKQHPYYKSRKF